MLFCRGDTPSINVLLESLTEFHRTSGLQVNDSKSSIFSAGITQEDAQAIRDTIGFQPGTFPIRYLGIPLAAQRLNVVHFAPLIDRITEYISAWTANSLSYTGKLELIRSIAQGVECYWLQIFPLPTSVIHRITRLCRVFLWGNRRPSVSWRDMCLPKEEGGVGLRDATIWNQALLAKILWNFHLKTDTLWIKWVHNIYLKNTDVWEWSPKIRDSPLLKSIASVRDALLRHFGNKSACIEGLAKLSNGAGLRCSEVYHLLRQKGQIQPWKKAIWKDFIPPKFSFTTWLAFKERLLTRDRLAYLEVDQSCSFCTQPESAKHLFFTCGFSQAVWASIGHWLGLHHRTSTLLSAAKWIKKERTTNCILAKARSIAMACTVYILWNTRNLATFEATRRNPAEVVTLVKRKVYLILHSRYPAELINF